MVWLNVQLQVGFRWTWANFEQPLSDDRSSFAVLRHFNDFRTNISLEWNNSGSIMNVLSVRRIEHTKTDVCLLRLLSESLPVVDNVN